MARRESIIIVGGGIAGLSAGCYGQMNEYKTKLYEMHYVPGGCCTAWKRGDYVFDPCIEWMWGTGAEERFLSNRMFREIGALQGKPIRDFDVFNCVRTSDGREVRFYVDADALEAHLLEISPEDRVHIKEYCDGVRRMRDIDVFEHIFMSPTTLAPLSAKLKLGLTALRHLNFFRRAHETSVVTFIQRLKSPALREAFKYVFFMNFQYPLMSQYSTLSTAWKKNGGYPAGGSLGVALSVARRYEQLGGTIAYRRRVSKILVDGSRAIGVEFEDGTRDLADIVISACDGRTVLYDLLQGKYLDDSLRSLYEKLSDEPNLMAGLVMVFLGIDRDLSEVPRSTTYVLPKDEMAQLPGPDIDVDGIVIQNRTLYDEGVAPRGKSVIFGWYCADFDYWNHLHKTDRALYDAEKKRAAEYVIRRLESSYPGIRQHIDVVDVSTPVTVVRYTANHRGSIGSWRPFSRAEEVAEKFGNGGMRLPGLENFYMSGQWSMVGGLIRAASTGRFAIQFACRDDHKKFKAFEN